MTRPACGVILGLCTLDLLCVLIGGFSLAAPAVTVSPAGLVLRLSAFFALFALFFRVLAPPARRLSDAHLLFVLLLMPTLQQFQFAGGRTGGDGLGYYVFVRSLWKDGDLHFANEYEHYGYQDRPDMMAPTRTGHRRSVFSIGPAVLWTPFFALGEVVGRVQRTLTGASDLSGYGPVHVNACSLGSLLYGFALVLLIHDLARRHFASGVAVAAAMFTWGGTFLHWYMVQHPLMAHALSGCAAGFCVWLWDRQRGSSGSVAGVNPATVPWGLRRSAPPPPNPQSGSVAGVKPAATVWGHVRLGLALGIAMTTRWQSGLLLLLPGLDLLAWLWRERRAALPGVLRCGLALAVFVALGAFPQMAAWKTLYDEWVLTHPPHGIGWVRLWRPFLLETLWSSRHGLLAWTPVFLLGYLGLVPLVRRRFALGAPLVPIVLFTTWVNACAGDWWAGGSYSLRRFDPLLLPLALGTAALLERVVVLVQRHPAATAIGLVGPFALWSLLLAPSGGERWPPHFPQVARMAWARMADAAGSPQTWPVSWLFAWRTGLSPGAYDLAVGRYLFFRQGNLGGRIELGGPKDDGGLLGEGFGPPLHEDGAEARAVATRARVLAPLDLPETLTVALRVNGPATLGLTVNGHDLGDREIAAAGWSEAAWRADAALWRQDLNDVVVSNERPHPVLVDYFQFTPEPRR